MTILDSPDSGRLARRSLLLLGPAGLVLAGCHVQASPIKTELDFTIESLLSTTPFYVAHRGSGDNWTEHTALAYASSINIGSKAIEVSVHATSDGVLVCHHDESLLRMTGQDLKIGEQTYNTISGILNDAREWLGPSTGLEAIPRLKDVLDAHANRRTIFIEDKQGTNTKALLDLMDTYEKSTSHFVWKQPAGLKSYVDVRARGYKTWGYFLNDSGNQFEKYALRHDFLGIYHLASDRDIQKLVGYGKPTICWEVHTRWMRDRLLDLGVQGMMCSNIPYVRTELSISDSDTFSSGRRNAGDLPSILQWKFQPTILPTIASVSLADDEDQGYSMGSMCPVNGEKFELDFTIRWTRQPDAGMECGVAFGQQSDRPYIPSDTGPAGYQLLFRADGTFTLSRRADGEDAGEVISVVKTPVPLVGTHVPISISVDGGSIRFARRDISGASGESTDTSYRGGYFSLLKNYHGRTAVEFSGLKVRQG